jgi:NAD(P)H-dependent FMN reductase
MAEDRYRLAVIIGSTRRGRIAPMVAAWFARRARARDDVCLDVIDLLDLRLPDDLSGGGDTQAFAARIAAADAVVVVTPEYNHGYPGPLKTAIDTLDGQWHAKPVGFVAYGGISGGLRAVEQLRAVFAELHAVTIRASVSLHFVHDRFTESGDLREPTRIQAAVDRMLDQLGWWARALRQARRTEPYLM